MADSVRSILIRWIFDMSDGVKSAQDFISMIDQLDSQQKASADNAHTANQQQAQDWQVMAAQIRAAIATESEGTDEIKSKRESLIDTLQEEIGVLQAKNEYSKQDLASARAMTAELERQKSALSGGPGLTTPTENFLGTIEEKMEGLRGLASGLGLGGGAAILGGGIGAGIALAGEKIGELVKSIAELVTESGQLTHVSETFESLSKAIGSIPVDMLNQLRTATNGLVSDMDLMKSANTVLLQGIPLTQQELVGLTGAVSQLATAQGKDAVEAMNLLSRGLASGRTSLVAYYLGLQDTTKEQLRLDQELPESIKYWAQYQTLLAAVTEQNERIGPQAETLTDSIGKLSTSFKDLFESIGQGVATSLFGEWMQQNIDAVNSFVRGTFTPPSKGPIQQQNLQGEKEKVGSGLPGSNVQISAPDYKALKEAEDVYYADQKAKIDQEKQDAKATSDFWLQVNEDNYKNGLTSFQDYIDKKRQIEHDANTDRITEIEENRKNELAKEQASNAELQGELQQKLNLPSAQQDPATVAALQKQIGLEATRQATINTNAQTQINAVLEEQNKQDQQNTQKTEDYKSQIKLQALQDSLKDYQNYIAQEQELNKQAFDQGTISVVQYTQARIGLLQQELAAYRTEKEQEVSEAGANAQKVNKIQQDEKDFAIKTADEIMQAQIQASADALSRLKSDYSETVGYYQKMAEASKIPGIRMPGERNVFSGVPGQLGTSRESSAGQQYEQQESAYLRTFTQNLQELIEALSSGPQAIQSFIKNLQDALTKSAPGSAQGQALSDILAQAQTAQSQIPTPKLFSDQTSSLLTEKVDSAFSDMSKAADSAVTPTGLFSKMLQQLSLSLAEALEALNKLNTATVNWNASLISGFSEVGKALSSVGLGKEGQGFDQAASLIQSQLAYTKSTGSSSSIGSLFSSLTNLPSMLGALVSPPTLANSASTDISGIEGAGPISDFLGSMGLGGSSTLNAPSDAKQKETIKSLDTFTKSLANATQTVGTFVQAMEGTSKNPIAGGVAGAVSGAQLAGQGVDVAKELDASISSTLGGALGAAGGVVGGIIGVFSAKAAKKAQELADEIIKKFNDMLNAYSTGQIDLVSAIQQAQAQEAAAIAQLSGQKGAGQTLTNIEQQMNQTIASLQSKQQQIFTSMQQTLNAITSPEPYQDMINTVQGIITTYNQYLDAGGDVTTANTFLAASFQNLSQTSMQTLNSDFQTAIQNALTYSQLLQQQAQAMANYENQVAGILSTGAATRTPTSAMSEMTQLSNLQNQYQQQQEQLQMQISVSGYQLDIAKQIFNLANTRIGLEQQLVQAQEQQASVQASQILALTQLVQVLQSGASITSVNMLLGLLGLGSAPTVPGINYPPGSAEAAAAAATTVSSSQATEQAVLELYNAYGSMGLGGFAGEQ